MSGRFAAIGHAVEAALAAIKKRHIPMNIDGITAVIFCELGFEPELGRGLFILSRSVGILAHAWEQKQQGAPDHGADAEGDSVSLQRAGAPRAAARRGRAATTERHRARPMPRAQGPEEQAMKDLIANQLVKYLEARGVEHIFGLCGHTNIAVLAALSKSKKIKFVNTRHEQIAAHAADGYARATKTTSVVLSHLARASPTPRPAWPTPRSTRSRWS